MKGANVLSRHARRMFWCTVLFLATTASDALAGVRPGIEAGVNVSSLRYDSELSFWDPGWRPSFTGGLSLKIPLHSRFALTTGLRYVQQGNRVQVNVGSIGGEFRVMQDYVSVPALLEWRPFSTRGFFLSLGPEVGILVAARSIIEPSGAAFPSSGLYNDDKDTMKSINVSMDAGASFEFPMENHLGVVTLRYTHGLTGVAEPGAWVTDWKTRGVEWLVGMRW